MNAVDTNVLLYVHDPRDPDEQQIASLLIPSLEDSVLLWQVACEYIAASRKLEPFGYKQNKAWEDVQNLQLVWTTVLPSWQVLIRAESLMSRFYLSFWDAMIIAACLEAGIERLYSEDFDSYDRIDGLELVNPFKKK